MAEPNEMPFGLWTWVGPRNHVLYGVWGSDPPCEGEILRGKGAIHCEVYGVSAVTCAKMAEPIEMSFVVWTQLDQRKHVRWAAHWRNLANATEPSMCGFDAAFLSNYFDHLLDFSDKVTTQLRCGGIFFTVFVCKSLLVTLIEE